MPRRQRQRWVHTCGECATETTEPLHLGTHGDWGLAMTLSGPGWALLLEGEEWFCSIDCFLAWLAAKIQEAAEEEEPEAEEPDDDFVDREDEWYAGLTYD